MKKEESNVRYTTIRGRKVTLEFADEPNVNLLKDIKSMLLDNWTRQWLTPKE